MGRQAGIQNAADAGRIWSSWRAIVGDQVADHAEPTSLRDGVLRVRAESPAWATELRYLAHEVRERVNASVGRNAVLEVRIWTGPGAARVRRPAREQRPRDAVPSPSRDVASEDPAALLDRVRAAWLRRRARRATGGRSEGV